MSKLPPEVVKQWPEIFSDVEVQAIPLNYVKFINVSFNNGKIWQVAVSEEERENVDYLDKMLEDLFDEYEDDILAVDFSLDTQKVKQDIQNRTKTFLKKRK